jgi:hypothetical protein
MPPSIVVQVAGSGMSVGVTVQVPGAVLYTLPLPLTDKQPTDTVSSKMPAERTPPYPGKADGQQRLALGPLDARDRRDVRNARRAYRVRF